MSTKEKYIVITYKGRKVKRNPLTGFFEEKIDLSDLEIFQKELCETEFRDLEKCPEIIKITPFLDHYSRVNDVRESVEDSIVSVQKKKDFWLKYMRSFANGKVVSWGLETTGVVNSEQNGSGIKIAILDDGFDKNCYAFQGIVDRIQLGNFFNLPEDFEKIEGGNHGVSCAGVICGIDNNSYNSRIRGTEKYIDSEVEFSVSPKLENLIIGKIIDDNRINSLHLLNGLKWVCLNGADFVNLSFGFDFWDYMNGLKNDFRYSELNIESIYRKAFWNFTSYLNTLELIVDSILQHSTIVIASAGNESKRNQKKENKRKIPDLGFSSIPSVTKNIISVGAIKPLGSDSYELERSSNRGATILAPGDSSASVVYIKKSSRYELQTFGDTSSATPHATGVFALWKQLLVEKKRYSVENLIYCIKRTAVKKNLEGKYSPSDYGWGLIQAPTPTNSLFITKLKKGEI